MFTTVPHTLDVDILREIPDVVGSVNGVGVESVHDARVVEDDVEAAPGVEGADHGGDGGFGGDVADDGFDFGG